MNKDAQPGMITCEECGAKAPKGQPIRHQKGCPLVGESSGPQQVPTENIELSVGKKIASMLDDISDKLEAKGQTRLSYEIDKISDQLEKVAAVNGKTMYGWKVTVSNKNIEEPSYIVTKSNSKQKAMDMASDLFRGGEVKEVKAIDPVSNKVFVEM